MVKGVRDLDVNSEVMDLLENGYFNDEISFYGCAYVKGGRIYYRLHEKEEAIRHFLHESAPKALYPTLLEKISQREKIPSGEMETARERVRMAFVQALQQKYPTTYFETLAPLAKWPAVNIALPLLKEWQEALFANFEADNLQLFTGALQMCYGAKLLEESNYQLLSAWQEDRLLQISRQHRGLGKHNKVFAGFAYKPEEEWRYFYDANELVVCRKHEQLSGQPIVVTPIFRKHYGIDTLGIRAMADLEKQFIQTLTSSLSPVYLTAIQTLKQLPSAIPKTLFSRQEEKMQGLSSNRAKDAFAFWGRRWQCVFSE